LNLKRKSDGTTWAWGDGTVLGTFPQAIYNTQGWSPTVANKACAVVYKKADKWAVVAVACDVTEELIAIETNTVKFTTLCFSEIKPDESVVLVDTVCQ